jgi:hypothetical protein
MALGRPGTPHAVADLMATLAVKAKARASLTPELRATIDVTMAEVRGAGPRKR